MIIPYNFLYSNSLVHAPSHPGLPKYRYLQCSRTLGSPSIAIYSVPALAQVTQDRSPKTQDRSPRTGHPRQVTEHTEFSKISNFQLPTRF